jgi:hypothetical protein
MNSPAVFDFHKGRSGPSVPEAAVNRRLALLVLTLGVLLAGRSFRHGPPSHTGDTTFAPAPAALQLSVSSAPDLHLQKNGRDNRVTPARDSD